ncbi:enterotoxin [Bacteroides sp. CAG:530]|nr:enterotoxin [Bacteroides sp. CAG:530]
MRKQIRNLLGCSLLTACLLSGQTMTAQSVIFPQEKQAGNAILVAERGVYTLQNDLLKAHFVAKNNHLFFDGCEQLGLLPGFTPYRMTY